MFVTIHIMFCTENKFGTSSYKCLLRVSLLTLFFGKVLMSLSLIQVSQNLTLNFHHWRNLNFSYKVPLKTLVFSLFRGQARWFCNVASVLAIKQVIKNDNLNRSFCNDNFELYVFIVLHFLCLVFGWFCVGTALNQHLLKQLDQKNNF